MRGLRGDWRPVDRRCQQVLGVSGGSFGVGRTPIPNMEIRIGRSEGHRRRSYRRLDCLSGAGRRFRGREDADPEYGGEAVELGNELTSCGVDGRGEHLPLSGSFVEP